MTWDAVAALAELLAALGVIVSMIYLARQIRTSTSATQRSGSHDVLEISTNFLLTLAVNPELSDLWLRGLRAPEALNDSERARVRHLLSVMVMVFEEGCHWSKQGHIAEWNDHLLQAGHSYIFPSPGFRELFWKDREPFVTPELRSVIEPYMRLPSPPLPPAQHSV